jgi:hypothetical protein
VREIRNIFMQFHVFFIALLTQMSSMMRHLVVTGIRISDAALPVFDTKIA